VRLPAAWLTLAALSACGTSPRPPSLLLISLDSVRADFVGAYGAALPHAPGRSPTPHLDRLASEGIVYENARSTTSWTLPAHASLFTGVPELVHGVEQDGERVPATRPTLAETLAGAGYRTSGVYSGPYLDPRHGFARGFERYEAGYGEALARAVDERVVAQRLLDGIDVGREPERAQVAVRRLGNAEREIEVASHRDVSSQRVTDLALEELARAAEDGRPFFLFAHYFDPHFDYVPPPPWDRAFDPDYDGALDGRDFFTNPGIAPFDAASPTGRRRAASERDLEHLEALYAGEIAWTDAQIGRLLEGLARLGLDGETLVVVVADHGDEFLEHGSIGHRQTLYEEVLRVPLILRPPGGAAPQRRAEPVVLADVPALVQSLLAGHPAPPPALPPVARLVRPETALVPLPGADARVPALRVRVLEAFHAGPLKLRRERSFLRATEPLAPPLREAFEAASRSERARETLAWIDLAAHPDEPDGAWNADFTEPRASAALELYRARLEALLAARSEPAIAPESAELLAALRGLGYAGQEARVGTLGNDDLVLPSPGTGPGPR